ncbi:MAG: restriction endonuclease [Nostoc sp. ChiSLP01]|nr:restriction endonuclease [Nostoc sp. CmiSLP01]MDZ8286295.1 restriction endonuclease [Nostoc sp. ChiSLP01]
MVAHQISPLINKPVQKIFFGSPGTGKSHRIVYEIIPNHLGIVESTNPENIIKTVFHPEYTYGDFMGKLVPITRKERVEYKYYEGHFLKALSRAYKNIVDAHDRNGVQISEPNNVALVIDEINRGNSSGIFGTVFQLLDRDENGWSSYGINITELEFRSLLELMKVELYEKDGKIEKYELHPFNALTLKNFEEKIKFLKIDLESRTIRIPPNLSILATMNTSDNSIYFMDSAFKRRWDWEFVNWDNSKPAKATYGKQGELDEQEWRKLITNLNNFIKSYHTLIRGIEDKQIGYYFIKQPVTAEQIQNKLMFFLWDSVFHRDKEPLIKLLNVTKNNLVTFGDFIKLHNTLIANIMNLGN